MSRPPNPAQTAATRARLADAATTVFGRRGFSATTMAEIAEEAGVSPGLAYRYCAGKEDLYRQALNEALDRVEIGITALRDPGHTSPAEQIRSLIDQYHEVVAPHPELPALLTDPQLHRWTDEALARRFEAVSKAATDWVRGLAPAPDLDIEEFALLVLSSLFSWFAPTPLARAIGAGPDCSRERTDRHKAALADLLTNALQAGR